MAVRYELPETWVRHDPSAIGTELLDAKTAIRTLVEMPFQREWVEKLQQVQLKIEVAGTSRIEGAEFTPAELDEATDLNRDAGELHTRSQRQARAAMEAYRWLATLPADRAIDGDVVREVHRRIVTGCDDDHCPPGRLRVRDQNVIFGIPPHRGCEGGERCEEAFDGLVRAVNHEFRDHDPLVQALALHYHLAAMHPFLDGNGRTARAMETMMLRRAGLRDNAFIAMSNYYYDEKAGYLTALSEAGARGHDLTPFLRFGLVGVRLQCDRLLVEITRNTRKALFRDTMYRLYGRLEGTRTRVLKERQLHILDLLLDRERIRAPEIYELMRDQYGALAHRVKAFDRDLDKLSLLGAIEYKEMWVSIRLDWPERITESKFFETIKGMPKAKDALSYGT